MRSSFLVVAFLLIVLLTAVGCNTSDKPPLAAVNGSITKNGQPFVDALIEFFPDGKGGTSYGTSDASGNFTLHYTTGEPGAAVGTHVVKVTGGRIAGTTAVSTPPPAPAPSDDEETFAPISDPDKPSNKRSAGPPPPVTLTAEVKSVSPNVINLVMP